MEGAHTAETRPAQPSSASLTNISRVFAVAPATLRLAALLLLENHFWIESLSLSSEDREVTLVRGWIRLGCEIRLWTLWWEGESRKE